MINLEIFRQKKCLLLIGPVGPFFYRFAKDLRAYGCEVFKINFSGGDFIFYPSNCTNFRGKPSEFPEFLLEFIKSNQIQVIFLFNDCKALHRIALKTILNNNLDVEIYVFESGYIRPDYITLEKDGVNGFSRMPKDPNFYKRFKSLHLKPAVHVHHVNFFWYFYSVIYLLGYVTLYPFFPASTLSLAGISELARSHIVGFIKRFFSTIFESKKIKYILKSLNRNYYFVPLQVFNDSQIRFHSEYKRIEEFIEEIMISFSKFSPDNTYLVLKHHPLDIGFKCYKKVIKDLSIKLGIEKRVIYIKSGDIISLVNNSIGIITINSTVGMTALINKKPVKTMGKAVYDIEGLTYKGDLNNFWVDALNFEIDDTLLESFCKYLQNYILINGSFYKRITKKNHTGLIYNEKYL